MAEAQHDFGANRSVFAWALWLGIMAGLIEVVLFLVLGSAGLLSWKTRFPHTSVELFAVAPLVNAAVLIALTGILLLLRRRGLKPEWVLVACLAVVLFDWLFIPLGGRLQGYALLFVAVGLAVFIQQAIDLTALAPSRFRSRTLVPLIAFWAVVSIGVIGGRRVAEARAVASLPPAAADAPNVLVIVVDTLRADRLGAYGYSRPTSPHLDALAAAGVLFENAIATSSYTLPSHASMLTGLYPREHGTTTPFGAGRILPSTAGSFARALGTRGYRTAAFSANTMLFTRTEGFAHQFDRFEDYYHNAQDTIGRTMIGRHLQSLVGTRLPARHSLAPLKTAADVNESVLRFLDRSSRPSLVFINYFDVHGPTLPAEPYRSRFVEGYASPIDSDHLPRGTGAKTPELRRYISDTYDGSIQYVDAMIAELLTQLDRRGLREKTLVVVTSDHGEAMGEHGYIDHGIGLHLGEIHVPLLMWWPGRIPAGKRIAPPVTNASIAATIADLLHVGGLSADALPSLRPLWEQPDVAQRWPWPRAEMGDSGSGRQNNRWIYSVLTPEWHLIDDEDKGISLYRWRADRREQVDLSKTPEAHVTIEQLRPVARGQGKGPDD